MRNQPNHTVQHELRTMFMTGGVCSGPPRHTRARWWPFAGKPSHLWCPRCSRCYRNGTFRLRSNIRCCPYGDCQAMEKDAHGWEEVLSVQAGYPEHPEHGTRYPARLVASGANAPARPRAE